MSTASKGAYYKNKTKKWLEEQGYQVAFLERMFIIGPHQFVKRDQLGSDLLAISDTLVLFVQVKGGNALGNVAAARRAFDEVKRPFGARQVVILWETRARTPRVWVRAATGDWREGEL